MQQAELPEQGANYTEIMGLIPREHTQATDENVVLYCVWLWIKANAKLKKNKT